MTFNVIIATSLSEEALAAFRQANDLNIRVVEPNQPALQPHLPDAHALIVGDEITVDASAIHQAASLKLIGRAGAGLNGIDVDTATRRGIIVMNTPGVDTITVAEYTFALMLTLVRNIVCAHQDLINGKLDRESRTGIQLEGKTLALIGLGRVGRKVAARAVSFGMEVLAVDPYVSESHAAEMRVKLVGLQAALEQAHIISMHASLVPETLHLLNKTAFDRMRHGVFIINTKDSSLIDESDMLEALDSGRVAGAAIDGMPDDPLSSALVSHPKVIHTSRMRDNTYEAQRDQSALIASQVIDALRGQDYRNAVNLPFMPGREYEVIAPQLDLAERIGNILHFLGHRAPIKRVSIEISGEEMSGLVKPMMVGILRGLLAPALGESRVNYINAPVLAAERGIHVTQTKSLRISTYPNLLSCQVLWDDGGELVVAGAIFNQTEPRIVQVDQYRTDFIPEGILLVMGSYDVPGVIGKTGTFMADHHINIAGWRTSRAKKGGNTLSLIMVDEPLQEELLDALRTQDFVRHLTQIIFDRS